MRTIENAVVVAIALATALVSMLAVAPMAAAHAAGSHQTGDQVADVRAATARFHDVGVAKAQGYAKFHDAASIYCIANLPTGTMGVHFVNGALVASGNINALSPQALVYEPEENGHFKLVAVEYIAFQAAWDATHSAPPMLFGHMFMLTTAPNRYGLPAFYSLHAWIWKSNPSGMFSMWNPTVHCDSD